VKAPLLQEQRLEYERLSLEATSLASQLASALSARESSSRTSESLRLDLARVQSENTILSQQLSDLGRQVRTLVRVLGTKENPSLAENGGDPNDPSFDEEEAAILRRAEEVGDTDAVVSAHLVTFHTLNALQAQNQKLLKITREMGARLEKGEEDARARVRGEENSAVREAHELVLQLKEEVEAQRERVSVGEKEREMLRRLVQHRGGALPASSAAPGGGEGGAMDVDSDAARLLVDVQAAFEAYKHETGVDMGRLREDLQKALREGGEVRTELAKEKARGEFTAGSSFPPFSPSPSLFTRKELMMPLVHTDEQNVSASSLSRTSFNSRNLGRRQRGRWSFRGRLRSLMCRDIRFVSLLRSPSPFPSL
jgi:nucleoprotein TPR